MQPSKTFTRLTIFAVITLLALKAHSQLITTIAGGNSTSLSFSTAVDAAGNIYIADAQLNIVRKVSPLGITATIAGNSIKGYNNDNIPAVNAFLNGPSGIALDKQGNVYVADMYNCRVRKIAPNGIITTIAGTGANGNTGDGGLAKNAKIGHPAGLLVDDEQNIYIGDLWYNRIRKIDKNGIITTFAGGGFGEDSTPAVTAAISQPIAMAKDAAGNIYIACQGEHRVRKIDTAGIITTIAGVGRAGYSAGRRAARVKINSPSGVAVDSAGNIYFGDKENNLLRKVDTEGFISTIAGDTARRPGNIGMGGPAALAQLYYPASVGIDAAGNIYVADLYNARVCKINSAGIISVAAGRGRFANAGDGSPSVQAEMGRPWGITTDKHGNVYIADGDFNNSRIRKIMPNGIITTVAGTGRGGFSGDSGMAVNAQINYPLDMAVDGAGNMYIADYFNHRIRKVDTAGVITTIAGDGKPGFTGDGGPAKNAELYYPTGICIDSKGNIYIADHNNNRIRKISKNGNISTVAGNGKTFGGQGDGAPAKSNALEGPYDVAVDSADNFYIAVESSIKKVDAGGIITTVAGKTSVNNPGDGGPAVNAYLSYVTGVSFDARGNMYIADYAGQRVRKVDSAGIISTVAGIGTWGYSGDGKLAVNASLHDPAGVGVDIFGNIYIADAENGCVRKVLVKDSIISFMPTTAKLGEKVTITGFGFTGATVVKFGVKNAASFTVVNDNTIIAEVGDGASGAVTVVAPAGRAAKPGFVMVHCPPAKNKVLNITGCNQAEYNGIVYTSSVSIIDTLHNVNGCDSVYRTVNITIKVKPVTNTINVTGCGFVVYHNITYTSSSTKTDTVKTAAGCDSIYTVANITIKPRPDLGADQAVQICPGALADISNVFDTTGAATAVWSPAVDEHAAPAGKYTLTITNSAKCKDAAVVTVKQLASCFNSQNNPAENKEALRSPGIKTALTLSLAPNPAISDAHLTISGARHTLQVIVTDMAGRMLWQTNKAGNGTLLLPVRNWAAGTYLVKVFDGAAQIPLKLVKGR